MAEHIREVLVFRIPQEVALLVIMTMHTQRTQFQESKPGRTSLFRIPELRMVIIWNTLNFGLTLMAMEF